MATAAAPTFAASSGGVISGVGSNLGGQMQQRLAALKVRYERQSAEVSSEVGKLSRTHRPSRYAFSVIFFLAVGIDVLNFFVDVLLVVDLLLAVAFFLCIRSLINRSLGMQRALATLIVLSVAISVLLPVIGGIFGGPLLLIVMAFGIRNPGVKVNKVDKEKIQKAMANFGQAIQKARLYAARLIKFGRRTRGLRGITTAVARSKAFRFFSKSSKTSGRLLASALAESIDFIAWIPFNTINSVWTYSDLKKADAEARVMLADYQEQESAAIAAETAVIRAQYTEQMRGIVQHVLEQEEVNETENVLTTERARLNPPPTPAARPPARTMRDIGTKSPVTAPRPAIQAPAQATA